MKKIIAMACLLTGLSAAAQTKLFIGPSGGFGHSFFVPYNSNAQFQPSYSIGLTSFCTLGEMWGASADVKYSSEGSLIDDGRSQSDIRLDYIRIPVKGVFYFTGTNYMIRPKIAAGPSLGILIMESGTSTDNKAGKTDFGINASGGFDFMLAEKLCLNMDVSYYAGLLKARPDNASREYNGNVGVNIGVAFLVAGR